MRGRTRSLLVAGGVVVFLLLTYLFLIGPRRGELGDVRLQVMEEGQQTQALQATLNRLRALQEDAPRLEARLAEIRELVPQDHEIPNFIFQVQQAANESGVDFLQISPELPKTPPEGAQLAEVRIEIGAKGGYFSVQDFLRRLYDLDRALRVDVVNMSGESQTTGDVQVGLSMSARIFFELPAGGATAGTSTETTTTTTEPETPVESSVPPADEEGQ